MATGQLQIIHPLEPEFFVLDVQEQPLGVNLFGAVVFLAFFEARREQQVVIGVLGFDFQGLLEVRARFPESPLHVREHAQSDKCIGKPRVQFQTIAVVGFRAFQISDPLEAFAHVATRAGRGVFKRQGLFVGVQRVLVPLHSDQGLRFLVVGGTECAFDGNGKIICIDGLGIATALLERIAHAVPGGKRVRLLLKELLVERCCLFELSGPLIAEGQFVDGRLVQGVLLQGFVQVADGFLPGAHVFVFQGNVNADFPLGLLVREDQDAFETVNGQLVLRHLAVHRAEGNEHFLVQGFDFQ